jgi:RNA polymerase sigma factor (sigma-70 family)
MLLNRFISDSSEESFHALVRRHGELVWDVCRSILRNDADAEDAFQATFLILATQARSVRLPSSLAAWLHGTAYRTARKARVLAARRREMESRVPTKNPVPIPDPSWAEVREAIHEEVARLPVRERSAVILCYLTGSTQGSRNYSWVVARRSEKRLERGRELLRKALLNRGFGPVAVLAGTVLLPTTIPGGLIASTYQSAIRISSGIINSLEIPIHIRSLIEGGTKMITITKSIAAIVVLVVLTTLGFATPIEKEPKSSKSTTSNRETTLSGGSPSAVPPKSELERTWRLIAVSGKGQEILDVKGLEFTFQGGKLEISDKGKAGEHTWDPSFLRGATYRSDPSPKLHTIDLSLDPEVAKDVTLVGIYQVYKGKLKIGIRTIKSAKMPRPIGYATDSGTIISLTLEPVGDR